MTADDDLAGADDLVAAGRSIEAQRGIGDGGRRRGRRRGHRRLRRRLWSGHPAGPIAERSGTDDRHDRRDPGAEDERPTPTRTAGPATLDRPPEVDLS
jgi:hypothetical protein